MSASKSILIVDDSRENRIKLKRILDNKYTIYEAENGREALDFLKTKCALLSAIILDIAMPIMDGYEFLIQKNLNPMYSGIPVVVVIENNEIYVETKAMKLGSSDFIDRPYNPELVKFRIQNAIDRSQLSSFKQLKYLAEYDQLTGVFNKSKLFAIVKKMLFCNIRNKYVFARCDIDRFQLINSYFGDKEGDNLLIYFANSIKQLCVEYDEYAYGRIEGDVFCFCVPYDERKLIDDLKQLRKRLSEFNTEYDIVPTVGIYIADRPVENISTIYDKAKLASKTSKGSYVDFYDFYDDSLREKLILEQNIINDMNQALERDEFEIVFHPKYDLHTNRPAGAEVLSRWNHPTKGMISPGIFIPVFERNGFIMKFDYHIWEKACKFIKKHLSRGEKILPLSVNVSRIDLYNPNLCDNIISLVEKYDVPPELLNIELTESAYTDNPNVVRETMKKLHDYGFIIMMDDFGSGYSSLNLLKDIDVDVIKIDMIFFSKTEKVGRGEKIISSVVRMAKWLNIPVVAEGVEKLEQVRFLSSIGCDYVQGHYFFAPMSEEVFEPYMAKEIRNNTSIKKLEENNNIKIDDLWSSDSQVSMLFNSLINAVALFEVHGNKIELIRANDGFYDIVANVRGYDEKVGVTSMFYEKDLDKVWKAINKAIHLKETAECNFRSYKKDDSLIWINMKTKFICNYEDRCLIYVAFLDITKQVETEAFNKMHEERYRILACHLNMLTFDYSTEKDKCSYSLYDKGTSILNTTVPNFINYISNSKKILYDDISSAIEEVKNDRAEAYEKTLVLHLDLFNKGMRPYKTSLIYIPDVQGKIERVVGQLLEISDIGVAEFKDAVDLFNNIATAAPISIFRARYSKGFPIVYANDTFYTRLGYSKTEFSSLKHNLFIEAIHPDDREKFEKIIEAAVTEKRDKTKFNIRAIAKNNDLRYFEGGFGITETDGDILINISAYDITELTVARQEIQKQNDYLNQLYRTVPCGIVNLANDENYTILSANDAAIELFGIGNTDDILEKKYTLKSFVNKDIFLYIDNESKQLLFDENKKTACLEYQIISVTGEERWLLEYLRVIKNDDGEKVFQSVFSDITNKKIIENELNSDMELLKNAIISTDMSVWEWDILNSNVTLYFRSKKSRTRIDSCNNFPQNLFDSNYYHSNSVENAKALFEKIRSGAPEAEADLLVYDDKHETYWWENVNYKTYFDENGVPIKAIAIGKDISRIKKYERILERASKTDSLTGLYNRKSFELYVDDYLEQEPEIISAFMMINIDNFRGINEVYGHAFGDEILKDISRILHQLFRRDDIISRLGGDEFAVFLKNIKSAELASRRANDLLSAVSKYKSSMPNLTLSCSVGVSMAPVHGLSFDELYKHADLALEISKKLGKNRFSIYNIYRLKV